MIYALLIIAIIAYFLIGCFVIGAVTESWDEFDLLIIMVWPLCIGMLIVFKVTEYFYGLGTKLRKKLRKDERYE